MAGLVGDALVVVCVGGTSSEWNAYRPSDGNLRCWTLGLASSIALGIKNAFCATTVDQFKKLCTEAMGRWEHTFVCAKVEPGRGEVPPWP